MDEGFSFAFLKEIGRKVSQALNENPKNLDWIGEVLQHYQDNQDYPEDLAMEIQNRLAETKEEGENNLLSEYNRIIAQETDNIYYFYDQIFQPEEEEEEFYMDDYGNTEIDFKTNIEPVKIDEKTLDPKSYFNYQIQNLSELLQISTDLVYLLMNHFFWDQDKITNFWLSQEAEKNSLLKKFRLTEINGHLSNLKEPLRLTKITEGECFICCNDENLYKLYCGHILCEECLKEEIIAQINENSLPICRYENEEGERCDAEIMYDDVVEILKKNGHLLSLYEKVFLNKEISFNKSVRNCPNPFCDWIITPANRLSTNVGQCYHCNAVTCMVEVHDSHAPLQKCELVNKFKVEIADEMEQLKLDQNSWMEREHRLIDYRHSHADEVRIVFDQEIRELEFKQNKEKQNEKKKIDEIDREIDELNSNISLMQRKLNDAIERCNPREDVQRLIDQVGYRNDEMKTLTDKKKLYLDTIKMNDEERMKDMQTAKDEASFFLNAISDLSMYKYNMNKFKESQDIRAYKNIEVTNNDDDYVKRITRLCPKCKTPLLRNQGCNHMTCPVCKFDFCWICDQPWFPTHGHGYFDCPNQKLFESQAKSKSSSLSKKYGCGIDFNNTKDNKFYPQPMTVEKRSNFIRYNNLSKKFMEEERKFNELKLILWDTHNDADIENGLDKLPFYKLCMRKRIEKALLRDCSKDEALLEAMKIINTTLFAQSVIMWSYPTMFFMASDPQRVKLFEFRVNQLIDSKDKMMLLIENPGDRSYPDFKNLKEVIENEIKSIIDDAEIF